jgi:chromosome segregation ATPase
MIKKFRNSLFGFNKDDVMSFVMESKESENTLKKKINELNGKIETLNNDIEGLQTKYEETKKILSETEEQLESYRQREEALTALSESIGRLYLVAKANAESVMASANESAEKSMYAVDKNIAIAENAESELKEISDTLNEKTREYLEAVADLKQQLEDTRKTVAEAKENIAERQNEMASIGANA